MICVLFVLMFVTRGHRFVISRDVALASIDGGTSRFACARMHARQQECIRHVSEACLLATLAHSGVRGSVFWPSDSSCITSRARDERTILH